MADTNFIAYTTAITAEWAQDVNNMVYRGVIPSGTNFNNVTIGSNLSVSGTATFLGVSTVPTPAIGDNSTNIANTSFVNSQLNGVSSVSLSNVNVTLTPAQYGTYIINLSGVLTGNVIVYFPTSSGTWQVYNGTSGTYTVTLSVVGNIGGVFVLPQGTSNLVWSDGTSIRSGVPTATTNPSVEVSQTVSSGSLDTSGYANCVKTGSGLSPVLSGSTTPTIIAFANGYGVSGKNDIIGVVNSDTSWSALPSSNTSFLSIDRNVNSGVLSLTNSLAQPQYGQVYNRIIQSKLDLNNSSLDDFGNTWTNNNVTFSNTSPAIAGTYMGVFNGTSSYMQSTAFKSMGNGGWTLRCKCKVSSSLASGNYAVIACGTNALGYGALLMLYNLGGSIKFNYTLSSTGTTNDIANAIAGTTTPVVGTPYDVELTFDGSAYRLYVNGVQEASTASSLKICPITNVSIGFNVPTMTGYFNGSIQGFEFLPYCAHPAGVSFTPQTTLSNVATQGYSADFYNIPKRTMYQISGPSTSAGTDPTMTAVQRVYVGEAVSGSSSISSVISYAYNGKYSSTLLSLPSAGSPLLTNHNLGIPAQFLNWSYISTCISPVTGYVIGQQTTNMFSYESDFTSHDIKSTITSKTCTIIAHSNSGFCAISPTTGAKVVGIGSAFVLQNNLQRNF